MSIFAHLKRADNLRVLAFFRGMMNAIAAAWARQNAGAPEVSSMRDGSAHILPLILVVDLSKRRVARQATMDQAKCIGLTVVAIAKMCMIM